MKPETVICKGYPLSVLRHARKYRIIAPTPGEILAGRHEAAGRNNSNSFNDVNILFNAATICLQSTAWKVGDFDGKTGRRYVMSNGVIGYNNNTGGGGGDSARSLFKIEKAATAAGGAGGGGSSKVYCPLGSSKV